MESEHNWFYCARLVNHILVCWYWFSMCAKLAPDSLESGNLFVERIHFFGIPYWAYWIGLFQHVSVSFISKKPPNTAHTGRWGFCGIFKHFSGLGFILPSERIHARPSASNANR
jgi:hypothetical protein